MTRRFNGKRRDVGAVKPKTMSVHITEVEAERLQVACWLLEKTTSGLMRMAVDAFLLQYKDRIDAAIRAKQQIQAMEQTNAQSATTGTS